MKFTLSWLKEHLQTNASLDDILNALVQIGLEVEHVENPSEKLKGFVVAFVRACQKHPQADRLSLCEIDDGSGNIHQVVCGAPNVRQGLKVAFAREGTTIPITGKPLKKGVIRGVESCGMLCSARELLLGEDSDGIMELSDDLVQGTDLAQALELDDSIIEVSITPNRGDCFSVRGIARDLAAFGLGSLINRPYPQITETYECPVHIKVEDSNTPYFTIRGLCDVKNGQSPSWVKKRLEAAGVRSISALVDVTNYLCLDMGRPLHVFDYSKIKGNLLHVRPSNEGEVLNALDEKTYTLKEGMTVIADDTGVISLAGVMGGASTGCDESTTHVLVESAYFVPEHIALTGQALSILSQSRTRFERGVDPKDVKLGLDLACQFIMEWCGGKASSFIEGGTFVNAPSASKVITLTQARLQSLSGDQSLTLENVKDYFIRLGFEEIALKDDEIDLKVPSWRHDIHEDVDLIEEALRLKGYDSIPYASLPLKPLQNSHNMLGSLQNLLHTFGYDEVYTWSFIPESIALEFGNGVKLDKPLTNDMAVLRPSILPGLLNVAKNNEKRSNFNGKYFEVASKFEKNADRFIETPCLAGLVSFSKEKRHWHQKLSKPDVFDIKKDVLNLLSLAGVNAYQIESKAPSYYHPGRSGSIKQGQKVIAYFGEIHPSLLKKLDLQGTYLAFEIFTQQLPTLVKEKVQAYEPLHFQKVLRDFAFWVDKNIPCESILKAIYKVDKSLIQDINIFDVYEGEKAIEGKKSIALEVTFQPTQKTLTDEELMTLQNKIIEEVKKSCGGVIRDH